MVSVAQLKDVPASPSLRPDIAELRSRVAQIAPQIKARAHTTEKAGRVPEENITALRNIGYFDIVKPAMFGGYEHDFDVLVELNIELAKSCASTAWVGGLLAAHQWLIAGFPEAAQRDVWASNPDAVACGSYAPAAKAIEVDGGYRLTGRWSFASGCDNAQWSLCAALLPSKTESGQFAPAFLLVPASDYVIDDTWNVVGLSGTGSKTLVLNGRVRARAPPAVVRRHHIRKDAGRRALCRQPHLLDPDAVEHPLLPGIGCGRRGGRRAGGLSCRHIAADHPRRGGRPQQSHGGFPDHPVARCGSEPPRPTPRAKCCCAISGIVRRRSATARPVSIEDRIVSRRGQAFSVALAIRATEALNASTGGLGLDLSNPVQRAWRDANAVGRHISMNWDAVGTMYGQLALGLTPQGQY